MCCMWGVIILNFDSWKYFYFNKMVYYKASSLQSYAKC